MIAKKQVHIFLSLEVTPVLTLGAKDGRWLGGTNCVGPLRPGCSRLGYPGYEANPRPVR